MVKSRKSEQMPSSTRGGASSRKPVEFLVPDKVKVPNKEHVEAGRRAKQAANRDLSDENDISAAGSAAPKSREVLSPSDTPEDSVSGPMRSRLKGKSETTIKSYSVEVGAAQALTDFAKANGITVSRALSEILTDCPKLKPYFSSRRLG